MEVRIGVRRPLFDGPLTPSSELLVSDGGADVGLLELDRGTRQLSITDPHVTGYRGLLLA